MIENTACENCPFKEFGMKTCPNYIETFWYEAGNPQPKLVKDCCPKRLVLMVQQLYNKCDGMQGQVNQAENQVCEIRGTMNRLIQALQHMTETQKELDSAKHKMSRHLSSMKYVESEHFKSLENQNDDSI
jgi:hypothetical protein